MAGEPSIGSCPEDLVALVQEAEAVAATQGTDQAAALVQGQVLGRLDEILGCGAVDLAFHVAGILHRARCLDQAERVYHAILRQASYVPAMINLGHLYHFTGRMAAAIEWRTQAATLCPEDPLLIADLGTSLIFMGEKTAGIGLLQGAVEQAKDRTIHSLYLMNLHYMPDLDPRALAQEHRHWAVLHAPDGLARRSWDNLPDPDRRLRVGYVSADFRTHPVAFFFESLLDGHDRQAVEVFGYSQVTCPDRTTSRIQGKFDTYRSIAGLDDETAAGLIAADRIDILVDLGGHTGGNRLGVFARKPSPIQVTYLGYPDTTGMSQIDYRLTDSLSTPSHQQPFYTETLVFLPEGFLCYRPPDYAPEVSPSPGTASGSVTFGVFNDTSKVNPTMTSLWAEILHACPGTRLLVKTRAGDDPGARRHFTDLFRRLGVAPDRLDIQGQRPAAEYLGLYGRVDIVLDTFPYNGTTTTCDALWMGVPVITLAGQHHASRVGLSLLARMGLGFFAATSAQEYRTKAVALARKPEALAKIRQSMRERMRASPVCDCRKFAREVDAAYRRMWRRWCAPGSLS